MRTGGAPLCECCSSLYVANGHTSSNTPDPIRTRKLSGERSGQYWGGGPPGKPLGCCWHFLLVSIYFINQFRIPFFWYNFLHSRTPSETKTIFRPNEFMGFLIFYQKVTEKACLKIILRGQTSFGKSDFASKHCS